MPSAVPASPPSPVLPRPIGVFDSGIGGLSILRALYQTLPAESFVYYADSSHVPYGERDDAFIMRRSLDITAELLREADIKALVVACNTATTVAIQTLRAQFTALPVIGVEPALKPAIETSRSRHVAVLATARTLCSGKYRALQARWTEQVQVTNVACLGLAEAIERGDAAQIEALCAQYMAQATTPVAGQPPVDTVVLGCTHYPLMANVLQRHAPAGVRLLDSASAVASQTQRRLQAMDLCAPPLQNDPVEPVRVTLQSSGDIQALQACAARLLGLQPPGCAGPIAAACVSADGEAGVHRPHGHPSQARHAADAPTPAS